MKTILSILILITLVLTTGSCKKEEKEDSYPNFATANLLFLKSIQASNEANEKRSPDYSDAFEISKVEREKDQLYITVTFPDGCNDSKFELIWNGLIMESYPEMIILYLRRTTDCTVPGNSASRILTVNLTEKLGDAALAQRVKVILCNTSKKANTENSDIPVSSN
jgi:hypothetical protein